MQYISATEFLVQSDEVKKVFRDWWNENIEPYDMYEIVEKRSNILLVHNDAKQTDAIKSYIDSTVPLLTETQLRNFIEDTANGHMDCTCYASNDKGFKGYTIEIWSQEPYQLIGQYKDIGDNLFKAYWYVARKLAANYTAV